MTVLVTGSSGTTGSRVARLLAERGADVRAVHRPDFDWADPSTFAAAVDGVDCCYLVPPTRGVDPAEAMPPFLEQARDAGMRRVVLLSAAANRPGGPGPGKAHALIPDLYDEWAVLQPSWFMQNVTGDHHVAAEIREHGTITTATATGCIAFVDADDIAAVATHALLSDAAPNESLVLTGPSAVSWDEVAALLTRQLSRPIRHVKVSMDELRERLSQRLPELTAAILAYLDTTIAAGAEDRTTDAVRRITGHAPRSFAEFVRTLDPG